MLSFVAPPPPVAAYKKMLYHTAVQFSSVQWMSLAIPRSDPNYREMAWKQHKVYCTNFQHFQQVSTFFENVPHHNNLKDTIIIQQFFFVSYLDDRYFPRLITYPQISAGGVVFAKPVTHMWIRCLKLVQNIDCIKYGQSLCFLKSEAKCH